MKKRILIPFLCLITFAFMVVVSYAQRENIWNPLEKEPRMESTNKASGLMGVEVKNNQGEVLGEISDLIFDSSSGFITFAIVSHEDKLTPVPMSAISRRSEKEAVVDISSDRFSRAPSFTSDNWPDMTDPQWTEDTYRYYGERPFWQQHEEEFERGREGVSEEYPYKEKPKF